MGLERPTWLGVLPIRVPGGCPYPASLSEINVPVCILVLPIGHVLIIAHVTRGHFYAHQGSKIKIKKRFWPPVLMGSTQGLSSIHVDRTIGHELIIAHVTRWIISCIAKY